MPPQCSATLATVISSVYVKLLVLTCKQKAREDEQTAKTCYTDSMDSAHSPLAERMRPTTLDQFAGQHHILGDSGLIRNLVESQQLVSLVLWGPPGSGKTTLARIIANEIEADFIEISAVGAKLEDVRRITQRAEENRNLQISTILFVDEIHRFNKAQQDAFLPHVESGLITLIGATTENPGFEVIRPLLSRCQVITLEPLNPEALRVIIHQAAKQLRVASKLTSRALECLIELSGGDARRALNLLEVSAQITEDKITTDTVQTAAQTHIPSFDKNGDMHYDLISAFIKSLRGNDINASFYYLARMLEAGEDPKFIARRMIIFASEDIGIATNGALNVAIATFQAVEVVGLPEAKYNLFHCTSVLARCSKSRRVTEAMSRALQLAQRFPDAQVPLQVRNAPTDLMKELGYGQGYQWQAGFKPEAGFLPEELEGETIWPPEETA